MNLADTSIWVDYFRKGDPELESLLERGDVLTHPFVIGELALGGLARRQDAFEALKRLPRALAAKDDEVLTFIESESLAGTGIGYVDTHLLAAIRLTPGAVLWTRDKRLAHVARRLSLARG